MLDTLRQGEKVGQPQILFRTANSDPAVDYTISYQGLVSDFYAAGLVSRRWTCTTAVPDYPGAATCGTFPDDAAFEIQYSPYGVDSGLCAGVAATAVAGEKVTLQPCGVSAKTVWIVDSADTVASRLRSADQRLGHQLLPAVRADLPGQRLTRPTCRGRSCTSPT